MPSGSTSSRPAGPTAVGHLGGHEKLDRVVGGAEAASVAESAVGQQLEVVELAWRGAVLWGGSHRLIMR